MLNYETIVTQAHEYRTLRLAQAEQRRLAQALTPAQPHPVIAWIGRQLIRWGQLLQDAKRLPALPVHP